jgi:hypothetical protein
MSKLFRTLKEVEQETLGRASVPVVPCNDPKNVSVTPTDLKEMLLSRVAGGKSIPPRARNCTLEEFERLEKEVLELQKKQRALLSRIKQILNGLDPANARKQEKHLALGACDNLSTENMEALIFIDRKKG